MWPIKIVKRESINIVGIHKAVSLVDGQIAALWQSFMPRKHEIQGLESTDLYSVAVYPETYFSAFNPATKFERWAGLQVQDESEIPEEMAQLVIPANTYAVIDYKGLSTDPTVFNWIHAEWLPNSEYQLVDAPHFEVLGARYMNNDPNSEEEIWIPVVGR